jgi:hypothetical protein
MIQSVETPPRASVEKQEDPDWEVILSYLPEGWADAAKRFGAFTRARGFDSPENMLRTLLLHLAQGCSLRETAIRAKRAGLADVSDVAILKRLRASEAWLHHLAAALAAPRSFEPSVRELFGRFRLCAVDATAISEPGSTGTDWRLHYMLELPTLACGHFELTDVHGGESLTRFPVRPGDLFLADRGYESTAAVEYVQKHGGEVALRVRVAECPLRHPSGKSFDLLAEASSLNEQQCGEWPVVMNGCKTEVPGRICVYRRDAAAAELARAQVLRRASRKGQEAKAETLEAAKYVALFTTVSPPRLSTTEAFDVYRFRWQIELAFKRLKTLTGFGHLPKHDAVSCRAWLYGKLLVGLLAESMARIPFFP